MSEELSEQMWYDDMMSDLFYVLVKTEHTLFQNPETPGEPQVLDCSNYCTHSLILLLLVQCEP